MLFFLHSKYLILLLLIPVFVIVFIIRQIAGNRAIKKIGDKDLVKVLMPSYSKTKSYLCFIFFCLAYLFLIIALARPQIGAQLKEKKVEGVEIMIVLDVSNSMLAKDYSPNRLERAKLAVSKICDKLKGDRIGLALFAGTSFIQLPITNDYVSAKFFLKSINTNSVSIQGTAIGDAIKTASKGFSPQNESSKAIIVITDGENHEDNPEEIAKTVFKQGIKVYTIGVGSPLGQPIPIDGELLKDKDGKIIVTKLDESSLKAIAKAGGGMYIYAGNEEFGLNPIVNDIKNLDKKEFKSMVFEQYEEQYMYFLYLSLFFFVLQMLVGQRKIKYSLFSKSNSLR